MALSITQPPAGQHFLVGNQLFFEFNSTSSGLSNFVYKTEVFIYPFGSSASTVPDITLLLPPVYGGNARIDMSTILDGIDFATSGFVYDALVLLPNTIYAIEVKITEQWQINSVIYTGSVSTTDPFYVVNGSVNIADTLTWGSFEPNFISDMYPMYKWLTNAPSTIKSNHAQLEFILNPGSTVYNNELVPDIYNGGLNYYYNNKSTTAEWKTQDGYVFFESDSELTSPGNYSKIIAWQCDLFPYSTATTFGDKITSIQFQSPGGGDPINDLWNTSVYPTMNPYRLTVVASTTGAQGTWVKLKELQLDDIAGPVQSSISATGLPININGFYKYIGFMYQGIDRSGTETGLPPYDLRVQYFTINIERNFEYFLKEETAGTRPNYSQLGNTAGRYSLGIEAHAEATAYTLCNNSLSPISRTITIEPVCGNLRKASAVQLQFQSDFGSTEYCTLYELEGTKGISRTNIVQPLTPNYTANDRGARTISTATSTSRVFVSDFLSKSEADWLLELVRSINVCIKTEDTIGDPLLLPMIVTTSEVTQMNESINPLYQLRVEMIESNNLFSNKG